MPTKIQFTKENTYFYSGCSSDKPPTEAEAKGRKTIPACCRTTADYLNRALAIGLTDKQKAIFEKVFVQHTYTDFNNYEEKPRGKVELPRMIEDIFQAAHELKDSNLQECFLDCVHEDIQDRNSNTHWNEPRAEFNELFAVRRERGICNTEGLKTDLEALCPGCPFRKNIPKWIEQQITPQIRENKELMPESDFRAWVSGEIKEATERMQEMRINAPQQPKRLLPKITETYLWNKERAKALKSFLEPKPSDSEIGLSPAERLQQAMAGLKPPDFFIKNPAEFDRLLA